jgi:hypothetical protein
VALELVLGNHWHPIPPIYLMMTSIHGQNKSDGIVKSRNDTYPDVDAQIKSLLTGEMSVYVCVSRSVVRHCQDPLINSVDRDPMNIASGGKCPPVFRSVGGFV